jgi:hypothetical protein
MKTHHPSRRGAAMSPVRRSARATCRGQPRRRLPAALKFRRHDSRRRLWVTRLWARPHVKQLALPERTSGRSGLTRRTAGRAPSSPRNPHLSKPTPPRRSEERSASAHQLYDGSDRPDSDSLQRCPSRGKSSDSVSTSSTPQAAEPGVVPRRLQSLLISGGRAPDVHVSLIAGGGHGPTSVVAEAGGSAPEQAEVRVAADGAADQSRAAPVLAGSKRATPE